MAEGRFSRWVGCLALVGVLGLTAGTSLVAGEAPRSAPSEQVSAPEANTAFSVVSPRQRAQWQQKLTLGPGDVLNFSLYGEPELTREEVLVGPDGRVSYLEAQGIMAAGLTVDEFREKLNEALAEYRRAPQASVSPVSYRSKKYFVLGKVTQRGAFPLDRPMTLVEAVARAGGMETGLAADRSMVELADLSRSFLARNGQRVPVDFEKLFQQGDLSQNVALEPNDYIYFPAGAEKEVYVLGAVRAPGAYIYNNSTGVVGAIAGRGGFSDRAWKRKLVVIRGGLTRPETFQVNIDEVLAGRTPDLKLNPKDIVFVHDRPWIYAEELLDAAANAFVTSAIVVWTTEKVTNDFQECSLTPPCMITARHAFSRPALLTGLVIALVLSSGCQSWKRSAAKPPSTLAASFTPSRIDDLPPLDPALLQRPEYHYELGPGDTLEIEIVGELLSRTRTIVGPDGKVYFNVLPGIDVWGMTLQQARNRVVQEMQRYVREEQPISVSLVSANSQRVWVLGRLNKPGVYPLVGPMTLLEAVSEAGGPAPAGEFATLSGPVARTASGGGTDEAADLSRAFVLRKGQMLRVDFEQLLREGDMSQNIYLQPDDFIYLPSATAGSVHVLGAVNNPRAVEYNNRMSLLQAVSQAGGTLIREAFPSQVAVVRGSLTSPQVAVIDMNAILRGETSDIALEPQDIVYVPHSPYRVLTRYLDTILNTFVRVVGVNEGARAVSDRGANLGVNVPLGGPL
jgi:protein involved in polysaccharide export with SLBB domain